MKKGLLRQKLIDLFVSIKISQVRTILSILEIFDAYVFEKFYKNEKIPKVKHQFCLTAQDFVLIWFIQLSNVGLQPPYQGVKKGLITVSNLCFQNGADDENRTRVVSLEG